MAALLNCQINKLLLAYLILPECVNHGVGAKEYEKSDAKTYQGGYKILLQKYHTRRPQRSFTFRTCLIYCRVVPHAFWAQLSILLQHELPPSCSFGIAPPKI
jgi:hypothetical protein